MFRPFRFVIEADAPQLAAGEQRPQRVGRVVDRVRGDETVGDAFFVINSFPMPPPPPHQPRHVVVGDLGHELVLAQVLQHEAEMHPCVRCAREVLRVLGPIPAGHVVEAQRGAGVLGLGNERPRLLALDALYGFGFAARRLLRASEKLTISDLESVLPERRARVAADGHGVTFRVWWAMNSLRSGSANILRVRRLPWPMATNLSAPEATWPLSVLIEQPSLAAACAAVLSPSGGGWRGLRWRLDG